MAKTKVQKPQKLAPFQKLLTIMVTGKPVTKDEIESTLGDEIYMYRLSTYMWHIKINGGVIKTIKEGRKAVAYQIMNVADMKKYMASTGITKSGFKPGDTVKSPSTAKTVAKLADLGATPIVTVSEPVTVVESNDLEVTEITQ